MSHLPGGALIAKEDAGAVAKHTEASHTKCGALLVRSLEVWCVTSRAGHSRAFQRINGESVVDIQVFGFISPIFFVFVSLSGFILHAKAGEADCNTPDFSAELYSFRHSYW